MGEKEVEHTLAYLSNKELSLCAEVGHLYASPPSSTSQARLQQVFSQYRDIHSEYVALIDDSTEALKRAVFIQWYALSEPNYLTGIGTLDEASKQKITEALKRQIKASSDDELRHMLGYYLLWDYVFPSIDKGDLGDVNETKVLGMHTKNRGQMGTYWASILEQKTAKRNTDNGVG